VINTEEYFLNLQREGINCYSGVPDSLLKDFCACISEKCSSDYHLITANEGAAIAYGIGHYLATGSVPFVYIQNSGLGNTINPVLSLASQEVYGIPMLIMVGWRGEPGVKDEPQHVHQGRVMIPSLESMDLPYYILDDQHDKAVKQTKDAISLAKKLSSPVFICVKKNTFTKYIFNIKQSNLPLSREDAIITTAENISKNSVVVCTTGMASRELFEYRAKNDQGHHMDFLTVGGMGHASQISLGISNAQSDKSVYCFDGDGAALMHMGSLAIIGQSNAKNFTHIIFNNGVHDSVGGQPTVGFKIDFGSIAYACGYKSFSKAKTKNEIIEAIETSNDIEGPHLIEVCVKSGNRDNIGRPTKSPRNNKEAIMKYLGSA
jgi:phosphonopyruvate decarboxylase